MPARPCQLVQRRASYGANIAGKVFEWNAQLKPSLRFRKLDNQLVPKELPALNEPASSLTSVDGGTYMFLFGGHDPKSKKFVHLVVCRDSWPPCVSNVGGHGSHQKQDFHFGGRNKFENDSSGIAGYSIAVYNPQAGWTWAVSDRPLPFALPLLGYSIRATPMDDGAEILLTRGYVDNSEDGKRTTGNFPSGIRWHLLGSMVAGPENHFNPSIVLVAWVPHTGAEDILVPEIWQYLVAPLPHIRCLNLQQSFLNLDLHSFVAVGNRMLLFGSEEEYFITGREPVLRKGNINDVAQKIEVKDEEEKDAGAPQSRGRVSRWIQRWARIAERWKGGRAEKWQGT
ncbi:hypothetical protein B0H13DRAFT_2577033 [Mycena leptocephala]|nr:hypothetical protein B0H13DRAFT_2577033 [Mycena leptocephala]